MKVSYFFLQVYRSLWPVRELSQYMGMLIL